MANQEQGNKLLSVNPSANPNLIREVPMNLGAEQALLGAIISNICVRGPRNKYHYSKRNRKPSIACG